MYLPYLDSHKNIVIIGGGLAGLCCALHLAQNGISVTLIEKEKFPRHKVCGEYISNEVLPYFSFLNIDIASLCPSRISRMQISTHNGSILSHNLPLGGFGISRFRLDNFLYKEVIKVGVEVIKDQVSSVKRLNDRYIIQLASRLNISAKHVIGAYGKRSILDRNLLRDFHEKKSPWLAVKAHYKGDFENDLVALHNFEGGYCGLSKVENDMINVCYLVNYKSFKRYKNIDSFQKEVLSKNPHLHSFFEKATMIFEKPMTISQISFSRKEPIEQGVLMIGDAAGLIHPLCGNGMAMAIEAAKIVSELILKKQNDEITYKELEQLYALQWKKAFSKRLYAGRVLQKVLLNPNFQNTAFRIANLIPAIVPQIIKQTHGKPVVCP